MSRCLNRATLIGYLGADPEIRTTSGGARVAQFSLATTRRWTEVRHEPALRSDVPGQMRLQWLKMNDRGCTRGESAHPKYTWILQVRWE
jgi:Single-strand binding protein family